MADHVHCVQKWKGEMSRWNCPEKCPGERNVRFPLPQCCHQLAAAAPTLTTNRYSDCNLPKFNELFHVVDRNLSLSLLFKFHENLLKTF